jgi:alpha-mannosidase
MLRSATAPDPEQDQGHHEFSFAIMPHQGRLLESGVYKQALQFINDVSIRTVPTGTSPENIKSPFQIIGTDSVILDVVKQGEDDEKTGRLTVILRMFESLGGRTKGSMTM